MAFFQIDLSPVCEKKVGEWRIVWDEGIVSKVKDFCAESKSNEIGGIVLGFIDQWHKSIFVVDVRPASEDHDNYRNHFQRDIRGMMSEVKMASRKTGNIVNYIGEWHSKLDALSNEPSSFYFSQLHKMLEEATLVDYPGVIMIVDQQEVEKPRIRH